MIAKCKCGSDSACETVVNEYRRYCLDGECGSAGPWQDTADQGDAAWNDLMGEPSVEWTTGAVEEVCGMSFVEVRDHDGDRVGRAEALAAEHFGPLADMIKSGPCKLAMTAERVETEAAEPHADGTVPAWCDTDGSELCPGFTDGTICAQMRCPHCTDGNAAMAEPPEEPAAPTFVAALNAALAADKRKTEQDSGLDRIKRTLANHGGKLAELEALIGVLPEDSQLAGVSIRDQLDVFLARLRRLEHPPVISEPTPDVEPVCPKDCRMVEFQRADGERLGAYPIKTGYRPSRALIGNALFGWHLIDEVVVYRFLRNVPVVAPNKPLRPEATGD